MNIELDTTHNYTELESILLAKENERFVFDDAYRTYTAHIVRELDANVIWFGDSVTARCGLEIRVGLTFKQLHESEVCSDQMCALATAAAHARHHPSRSQAR